MSAYILLPALTHPSLPQAAVPGESAGAALSAHTPVQQGQTNHWQTTTLQAALAAHPRAKVLLHPADAPIAVLTLPPLPAARRDAALRVVLEERVLGEVQSLALAVQPLGAQRFAVAYCERGLLAWVQQSVQALGAANAPLGALAAHLPTDSTQRLGDWQLWVDAQGAGALPTHGDVNSNEAAPSLTLQASPLAFQSYASAGSVWVRWRWAGYAALLCVAVGLAGQFAYWRSLVSANALAQARINLAFNKALPNTPVSDAIKQLRAAASGGADTTALAAALAKLPPEVTPAAVQSFEWRSGSLTVTLSGKTLAYSETQKSAFAQRLQTAGVTVRWGD